MSKRFIYPQQYGERKKPKLDVTISDHNFPLSQNAGTSKDSTPNQQNTWGDENDDEILLLASQACEEAYNGHNDSCLPEYSMCMQPSSTSTQLSIDPMPSASKAHNFSFKKPMVSSNLLSTSLKDKCNRISSPLHGITPKAMQIINGNLSLNDDSVFNDKIYKGQDSEYMYKQMLQVQEDNAKLKTENGKLLEKCITKEGEASILRTQLKTCQVAIDKARLDKIKAQEKVQQEWMEKLTAATNQMQDLRTQLDFKNLEIISIKEKCKMLESSKVKLTQVTVPGSDIYASHRLNSSQRAAAYNEPFTQMQRPQVAVSNMSVQTESKSHFVKLHQAVRNAPAKLKDILPLILQPSKDQISILDYSEKLQKTDFSQNKCCIFSTFHRIPSMTTVKEKIKSRVAIGSVHEDVSYLAAALDRGSKDGLREMYSKIINVFMDALTEVLDQLQAVAARMTAAFQKEMDEKYVETTSSYVCIDKQDLLSNKVLYKGEQGITARRLAAVLSLLLECSTDLQLVETLVQNCVLNTSRIDEDSSRGGMELICQILNLMDSTATAVLFGGFLLSLTTLLQTIWGIRSSRSSTLHTKLLDLAKTVVTVRPIANVSGQTLTLIRKLAAYGPVLGKFCADFCGNLKVDYDQGVLLYKKDTCHLQVLLKQLEVAFKCMERQSLIEEVVTTTQELISFYSNINSEMSQENKSRCECQQVTYQIIIYALSVCVVVLKNLTPKNVSHRNDLESIARAGILLLYRWVLRDNEFNTQLGFAEGQYHLFLESCEDMRDRIVINEVQGNMLTELVSTLQVLQSSAEDSDSPSELHKPVWVQSFSQFTIAD